MGRLIMRSAFKFGKEALSANYFTGSVDEVGLWNRLLTSGEVTDLWNGGVGLTTPFPAGFTKQTTKAQAAACSFVGACAKSTAHGVSATLSFVGSIAKRSSRGALRRRELHRRTYSEPSLHGWL